MIIYSSSAGSGKTFTLVKEYLKIALKENNPEYIIPHILAITFTNNATNEMKDRIISYLEDMYKRDADIMFAVERELNIDRSIIRDRSKSIIDYILSNYHDFSVMTIDSFLQRMLRSFAVELEIPYNYELILDEKDALRVCIEEMIDEYGKNRDISETIREIVIGELAKNKSWRVENILMKEIPPVFMRIMDNYNIENMNFTNRKWVEDFYKVLNMLKSDTEGIIDKFIWYGKDRIKYHKDILAVMESLYNRNIPKFGKNWNSAVIGGEEKLLKKKRDSETKAFIESELYPYIKKVDSLINNEEIKKKYFFIKWFYYYNLFSYLKEKTDRYRLSHKSVFMKETTKRIRELFRDDTVPFIYYKIGTKFNHYLIDEFQDTARDQWEAILPLIEEAESIGGTVIVVGDIKQAIYRWREGDKEIMKNLDGRRVRLDTNYRSLKNIVEFNNLFFEKLKEITNWDADNITQRIVDGRDGGYIEIGFSEKVEDDIGRIIDDLISRGYSYSDIAVLIRKNREADGIIDLLIKKNIPFTSPDSLRIGGNIAVEFTIDILNLLVNRDRTLIGKILSYIGREGKYKKDMGIEDVFEVFDNYNNEVAEKMRNVFKNYKKMGFYETIAFIADISGEIFSHNDAYLYRLLDYVDSIKDMSITAFLEQWNDVKDKIQIKGTGGENAISIMTIHKSKGLGFPVVIMPYVSWKMKTNDSYIVNLHFNGEEIVVNTPLSSDSPFEEIREEILKLCDDEYNLLYVAFTRAKEELYILGGKDHNGNWSGIFADVKKVLEELGYTDLPIVIGEKIKKEKKGGITEESRVIEFCISDWTDRMVVRRDRFFTTAKIDIGDCLHYALYLTDDYENGIDDYKWELVFRKYPVDEKEEVKKYYNNIIEALRNTVDMRDFNVMKEISFVYKGKKGRMDILFVNDKEAVVCDYKSGLKRSEDVKQIRWYKESLENMGYKNVRGYLIYADGEVVEC